MSPTSGSDEEATNPLHSTYGSELSSKNARRAGPIGGGPGDMPVLGVQTIAGLEVASDLTAG